MQRTLLAEVLRHFEHDAQPARFVHDPQGVERGGSWSP